MIFDDVSSSVWGLFHLSWSQPPKFLHYRLDKLLSTSTTWWTHDLTHGLPLLPVLASQVHTSWHEHVDALDGGARTRNQASKLWRYACEVGAHRLSWQSSMPVIPLLEQHGGYGSSWLSGRTNKVNCRLAAQHSSNASKADPSARAADLVLFNEM